MANPARTDMPARRRGLIVAGMLAFVILLPFLIIKISRRTSEVTTSEPKSTPAPSTPAPVEKVTPEPQKPPPAPEPEKPKLPVTWQSLPRIVRFRNPMADNEGGSKQQEWRVLLEDGIPREEVEKVQAFIKGIDRKLDEAFGDLPLFARHGGGDAKGGPDAQVRMLTSAAYGNESIEGVDPVAVRVRAICRLTCYDRNEESLGKLITLARSDPDPDVQVAAAVAMAAWKADEAVVTWMQSQPTEGPVSAFIGALQFPNTGSTHMEGHTYRERLMPRFGVGIAQALVDARRASTDPLLRQRALSVLGVCAYEGRSVEAVDELFREAEAATNLKSETFAFRGLMNALELESTRTRLGKWAGGSDDRLAGRSIQTLGTQLHSDCVKVLGEVLQTSQGQRAQAIISELSKARGSMTSLAVAELERTSQGHSEETIRALAAEKAQALKSKAESSFRAK